MNIEADKIMIVGDVHANFQLFNTLIDSQDYPDVVIQCGDYGWWPHFHNTDLIGSRQLFDQYGLRPGKSKVFWTPGNHENWDDLTKLTNKYGRVPIEVQENVFFMPRGSVLDINGMTYLFLGGADSIDKGRRIEGLSWWREENISYADIEALPDIKIDIVVSHTCPKCFLKKGALSELGITDPNCKTLDYVFEKYKPHYWFFAHYHLYQSSRTKGCLWRCFDKIDGGRGKSWMIFHNGVK